MSYIDTSRYFVPRMDPEERQLSLAHSMIERRRYRRLYWRVLARNAGVLAAAACGLVVVFVLGPWALAAWLGKAAALPVAVLVSLGLGIGLYSLDQRAKGQAGASWWAAQKELGASVADCNRWIRRLKRRQRRGEHRTRRLARRGARSAGR